MKKSRTQNNGLKSESKDFSETAAGAKATIIKGDLLLVFEVSLHAAHREDPITRSSGIVTLPGFDTPEYVQPAITSVPQIVEQILSFPLNTRIRHYLQTRLTEIENRARAEREVSEAAEEARLDRLDGEADPMSSASLAVQVAHGIRASLKARDVSE